MTTPAVGTWPRVLALALTTAVGGLIGFGVGRAPPTEGTLLTNVDIGFAQDMTVHHQQAVTMSDMVAQDVAPEVLVLADQMRFTQLREIGIMTGWLQIAGEPLIASQPMAWMHERTPIDRPTAMPHKAIATIMPGLASPQDLQRLQRTRGLANETIFLQLMTRHHQGGIAMAAHAIAHTHARAVHDTAMFMVSEQMQELQLMATLLQDRGASPLPYP